MSDSIVPIENISTLIHVIRGQKVLLDSDLAKLYEVDTRTLNQAVKRHRDRFPDDFMFQLTKDEFRILRSQSVISSLWGGRRVPPCAFSEQGVAMLSSVLNSSRAIQVNIGVMRAFVRLRETLAGNRELAWKLKEMESKYDHQFKIVFEAIRQLMPGPEPERRRKIGFGNREESQ